MEKEAVQDNIKSLTPETQASPQEAIQPSAQVPKVPKKKTWLIIGASTLALLFFGTTGFFAYQNYRLKRQALQTQPLPVPSPTAIIPFPTPSQVTPMVAEPDKIPQINSLYLGQYQGKDAIFVTNARLSKHHESSGIERTSPTVGSLKTIEGIGYHPFDYTKLQNPRRILLVDVSEDLMEISNFTFSPQKDMLYVVLNFVTLPDSYPDVAQRLYQINLNSLKSKQIWAHKIGDETYPKKGPAGIDRVANNKYIVLWLGICYACEGFDPHGSVVLNIETSKEKYLGEVDNFKFNLANNTVSYQKLMSFEETCEPSPRCVDGKRTVYKPSGKTITDTLP